MLETALITGASSGIGHALAKLFAADGSQLVLTARSEDKLNHLAEQLRSEHGVEVHVYPCDLTDPSAPGKIADFVLEAGLQVDVLVNNAGIGDLEWFWKQTAEKQQSMIAVNITALTELTRKFLNPMRKRNHGRVLTVASTAAFVPGPHMALYYATKAFVLSLSEAIREEHRKSNIQVTCLCPGPTETAFAEDSGMGSTWLFKFAMPVDRVARAGYIGMRRGKAIIVPGLLNKLVTQLPRFLPRVVIRWSMRFLQPIPKWEPR